VVLGRQQLFTENTLTPILPLLFHRNRKLVGRVARLWAVVLVANIAGTWAIAAVLAGSDLFPTEIRASFEEISSHALGLSFGTTLLKGIFAGWLIALMVWLMPAAGEARSAVIIFLTWLVSVASFAHVIAGSVDAAFFVLAGKAGLADYAGRFFAPTLLGNIIGGVALVAVLNFGQVATEVEA
jgi:formate-nitrite transporter family protein